MPNPPSLETEAPSEKPNRLVVTVPLSSLNRDMLSLGMIQILPNSLGRASNANPIGMFMLVWSPLASGKSTEDDRAICPKPA